MILRHTFSPPDNVRMGHLCGPLDTHIRSIEAALNVKVAHRFEQFRIEGTKPKVNQALETLQAMYEMAKKPIPPEQVQLMLSGDTALADPGDGALAMQTRRGEVRGRTPNQARYLENMATHDITFGIGPAGTGKTYLAVACAVDALERSAVQRIVLTRPAVEAGEKLGFLPGDLGQKVDPYLRPLYDALYDLMGAEKVQKAFREEIERSLKTGFTEAELRAAQRSLLSFRQLGRAQDNRLAAAWASNLNLGRDFSVSAKVDAALGALTLEQVNEAWRRYIKPEAFVAGVAGDFAKAP